MFVLGITGGIGAGKSRILSELEQAYGAYVVEADRTAHALMEPGMPVYHAVVRQFGTTILQQSGAIDRTKLADIVFSDEEKLALLNSLSHPLVREEILRQISEKREQGDCMLFVVEAALLIQDGYREICDEIWYIRADKETRIARLMLQRGYTREKCLAVMESQQGDEYYMQYADFTINNQFDYENSSKQLNVRLNKLFSNAIIRVDKNECVREFETGAGGKVWQQ